MNMFKGLLFLDGHFTRAEDLDDAPRVEYGARTAAADFAAPLGNRAASAAWFTRVLGRPARTQISDTTPREIPVLRKAPAPRKRAAAFLEQLLYLGGRPMHAGHNDDLEEPFEQLSVQVAAERRNTQQAHAGNSRRGSERRNAACELPQPCNG